MKFKIFFKSRFHFRAEDDSRDERSKITTFQAKEAIGSMGVLPPGIAVHFAAAMISGVNTAFVSMPLDIAKTR